MLEAMARALPCIGSNVGGIPELLSSEDLVSPGDVDRLADKISEVLSDPQRMARMSERNWRVSQEYRYDVVRSREMEFYRQVRIRTEQWLAKRQQ
jgi:glycosyltransferase involved in cell wall biosynthesis